MENFHAPTQRFRKRRSAHRHHHKFLEVDVIVGMRSTVQNVHHRRWQRIRARPAQIAIERYIQRNRRRARRRHRHRQDGVRAQTALVLGTVKFDHLGVEPALIEPIPVRQGFGDLAVDVLHRLEHSFAQKTVRISVAQLDRLVLAGRCAAGNNRAAHRAVC